MPLERLAIFRDFFLILLASFFSKPIVLHLRGGLFNLRDDFPKLFKWFLTFSIIISDKIIVLGEKEFLFYSEKFNIKKSKIVILPNAVETVDLQKKKSLKKRFNILFLGRLDKNKGLSEIIDSLSSLNINFILKIAGDGDDKNWFLRECDLRLKNKFEFHDVVYGSLKNELLMTSDVFLLPSYFEGLPNALLEAMSYGVVPVVTQVGSIPDVVIHNKNGIFISVKDTVSISESLMKLYNDYNFFNDLSLNAQSTIKCDFSIKNYLIVKNKIYTDLLK
jgi:glycosyltransferase involved in cell wall biosynthesis